jgi:hypothetical protein
MLAVSGSVPQSLQACGYARLQQQALASRSAFNPEKTAIYFRPVCAGWPMTSTLNYALAAVVVLGLFAVTLAFMVW